MPKPRSFERLGWLPAVVGIIGCANGPSITEALPATAPECAAACVEASSPTRDDIGCIRDACAPAGDPQTAGVA